MPAAARVSDQHTCPKHVAGPIKPSGEPTVLIGSRPAARMGDAAECKGSSDTIKGGEPSVKIGNKAAARVGDPTSHGGKVASGCPTVLIGSSPQASALKTDKPFCEECEKEEKRREKERKGRDKERTGA